MQNYVIYLHLREKKLKFVDSKKQFNIVYLFQGLNEHSLYTHQG